MDLSAVSTVLETIGGLALEAKSLLGVEDQVDGLERELRWMQSFLKEVDARKADITEVVRRSVAEIRELAYDAEDIIETFGLKVSSKRERSNFIKRFACFLNEGWSRCQAKKEIEKITSRIKKLTRQLQTYNVSKLDQGHGEGPSSSTERRKESRRPFPHIIDDHIIGLDEDINKLIGVLIDEKSDCRVVSICGMGGMGKTTLAKKVYQHSIVRDNFSHLAWVYVSQQCQRRKVWEDILSGLHIMDKDKKKRDEELAENLFNILKDKRCLVILDDIWSIEDWESIKPALPMRETRSKIVLTTRNKDIVLRADRRGYLHELECLKEEDSWKLFESIAFSDKYSRDIECESLVIWTCGFWEGSNYVGGADEYIVVTSNFKYDDLVRNVQRIVKCDDFNNSNIDIKCLIATKSRKLTKFKIQGAIELKRLLQRDKEPNVYVVVERCQQSSNPPDNTALQHCRNHDNRDDGKMKEFGENIVKHCAGLPLAIVVVAGILATKNSLHEWQIVYTNVKRGKQQGIDEVLALSYDDLPSELKPCFLYLSHFPEDYEINVQRLIQLWIAEGIVPLKQEEENGGEIIEDVAEGYLIELVERCMIQVRERDVATLKIKTIQMHDLMRDLCLSKAKQANFLFIIGKSNANSLSTIRMVRRVSAHEFFWIPRIKSPNIRSLLFFDELFPIKAFEYFFPLGLVLRKHLEKRGVGVERCNPLVWIWKLSVCCIILPKNRGIWTYIFNNFKLLRVLDFERDYFAGSNSGCQLPNDIGNLIHLRFLSIKYLCFISSKLPTSLGNLRCLLTLDLRCACGRRFSDPIHVPNVIWRMKQLRHLYLPQRCTGKTKLKLDTLRNLQTLVDFNTKSCYVKDLINMTNLRELEIRGHFVIDGFKGDKDMTPIIGSKSLQSLSILRCNERIDPRHLDHLLSSCVSICKLSLETEIGKLPEYHRFSQDITYIYLLDTALHEDSMPILEKLRSLRTLKFNSSSFTGKTMICSVGGFPKLDSLSLESLDNLEEWKVEKGAMPALRSLELIDCQQLKQLPDGLKFITTLQELKIEWMPKAFKDKVVEGGEGFYKIQHVPSVIFQKCIL